MKRKRFVLYKSIIPKVRYLRTTCEPVYPYLVLVGDVSTVDNYGFMRIPTNFPYNAEKNYNDNLHDVYGLTESIIEGENLKFKHIGDNDDHPMAFAVTAGADLKDTVGSAANEFHWPPGTGFLDVVKHYNLGFVENTYVHMDITQLPLDKESTSDAAYSVAGTGGDSTNLGGFIMYHRNMNHSEYTTPHNPATAPGMNPMQDCDIYSRRYPYRSIEHGFRRFRWKAKFNTLRCDPNSEIDTLCFSKAVGNDQEASTVSTDISPPSVKTWGEIGWIIDRNDASLNTGLLFRIAFKIVKDIILFDRGPLAYTNVDYDVDI